MFILINIPGSSSPGILRFTPRLSQYPHQSQTMLRLISVLVAASCFRAAVAVPLECGSPSNAKFTSGQACSGCASTVMDLNSLNTKKNEAGCIAAVSGAATSIKGYPCVTVKSSGGKVTACTMHQTCGTVNATDSSTKSCLFTLGGFSGITKPSECPADAVCSGGGGAGQTAGTKELSLSLATITAAIIALQ